MVLLKSLQLFYFLFLACCQGAVGARSCAGQSRSSPVRSRALGAPGAAPALESGTTLGTRTGGTGTLKYAQPGGACGWGGQGCGELETGFALFPCKAAVTLPSPSPFSHLLLTTGGRGQTSPETGCTSTSSPPCLLPLPSNQIHTASIRHGLSQRKRCRVLCHLMLYHCLREAAQEDVF